MLDSESYAVGTTWGNGTYVSLLPYVKNLPKGLIDSFGLQGFPWAAPANKPSEGSLYDPGTYLRADFAIQASQSLGIKDIWFNTGTFSRMYVGEAGATVSVTAAQRQQLLNGIAAIGKATRAKGYTVSIHLFAQNKAATSEATDWSYWSTKPGDTDATAVFTTFTSDAAQDGLALWLYDTE